MMERRRHKRAHRALRIFWRNETVIFDGVTLDICPQGVFVVTNQLLPLNSIVDIELHLTPESLFRCQGRITWVNRGQLIHYPAGFGVQFLDMEKDSVSRLLPLCCATTEQQWPLLSN